MTLLDTDEPANPFGEWLEPLMKERNINQTALAKAAGLGQSTISSYLSGERMPQNRKILAQVVRALLPNNADEEEAEKLFEQGLRAMVGLDADDNADLTSKIPRTVIEFYEGDPEPEKVEFVNSMIQGLSNIRRMGAIPDKTGKDAE